MNRKKFAEACLLSLLSNPERHRRMYQRIEKGEATEAEAVRLTAVTAVKLADALIAALDEPTESIP